MKAHSEFRPLLKWPGGKAREWDEIEPFLPGSVRHFVDPFMGGLAPFARTPFTGRAWLNDRHARLVDLHRRVQRQDVEFLAALESISVAWDRLERAAVIVRPAFIDLVDAHREGRALPLAETEAACRRAVARCVPEAADAVVASVADKAGRLARLETKHDVEFTRAQLPEHCETAVRAGFYTFVRERENDAREESAQAAADFLFVRETCYGSMFRFNSAGRMNIPYGGRSYNGKSLRSRIAQLRAPVTVAALRRAEFASEDFEPFLARLRPELGPGDFVFADPPYDSDFKSYGTNAFTQDDHRRLAASLAALPCPWMLVIQETDFVRATYLSGEMQSRGAFGPARACPKFRKQYGYNVRGRNDRDAHHLIVRNWE